MEYLKDVLFLLSVKLNSFENSNLLLIFREQLGKRGRVIMLVPRVPLVKQQKDRFNQSVFFPFL